MRWLPTTPSNVSNQNDDMAVEHAALVGDGLGHDDVERRQPVGGHHEQAAVAGVVDVAHLARVEVRQSVGGHVVASRGLGAPTPSGPEALCQRMSPGRYPAAAGSADTRASTVATNAATCWRGGAHEVERLREHAGQLVGGEAQAFVGGESLEQVVALGALLAQAQRGGDGALLDGLVGLLATDAVAHRRHQHLGGGEERQVAVELALDHRRVGAEVVEHGEEGLEQPVDGEEGVGQRDPPHDRAAHVALVPLVAGERPDHGEVARGGW